MDRPIRVGIVGSRFAAEFHYTAYQRVTGIDVKVVGATSLTKEHREDFAKKREIRVFNSLEEMIPEIDVVDVCTPGYAHEEVSITALETGKHVVVEKPFTGYFGPSGDKNFKGNRFSKEKMLEEAIATDREPKSGMLAASDVVSVLYAAYVSAERKGAEVEIPINSSL